MKSETKLSDTQPPPKPPARPGGLLHRSRGGAEDSSLDDKLESLKQELTSLLKNTEWPAESTDAAEEFLKTINSSPDISSNTGSMTQELRIIVERYIQILDDVRIRLKDASSKSEMKRWKFLERIRSLTSNRRSKCTLLFQTCRDDVSKGINALNARLNYERGTEGIKLLGPLAQTQSHSDARSMAQDSPTGPAEPGITSDDSTPDTLLAQQPLPNISKDGKDRSSIGEEALSIARKTFKSVEIGSGAIPVVGSYVGAAAKVGLAFVEMLQTMGRNDSLAIDLGNHTSRLTKLLGNFNEKSNLDEQAIAEQINDLHAELVRVKNKVEEWGTLGRLRKAFSARDQAERLEEYQATVQTAREEMQLLVGLDSRNIVLELQNNELRRERRRLLKCLGDGQYGARGSTIENIICFPGTRQEILKRIDSWIRDASVSSPVLWMCGMAGRGKSTIASTVAHNWRCRASCAIFHFRRGQSAVNSRAICAVARQLGSSLVSNVKDAILESVRENEDIADPGRRLDEQFETLLVAPFAKLKHQDHPIVIVIDALDECDNQDDAVELIRLIHKHSSSFPKTVKFLLTCRPEAAIIRNLGARQWCEENLDSAADMDKDLTQFLQAACTRIKNDHDLSEDWPRPGDVEQLVQMSQGLFQWARTAITYINNGSPMDRLRALLKRPSVWSGLDDLYHQILSKAFDSLRLDPSRQDILNRVLGTLVVAPHPVSLEVIATLYEKHEIFDGDNRENITQFLRKDVLADLNSLLFIPESSAEPMRLMHTSIQDLLSSELRCKQRPFYVDATRYHQQLAIACFQTMLESLKENICHLSDVSRPVSEVQDIVERGISKGLEYCCRAWSTYLTQGVKRVEFLEREIADALAHFESFSEGKIMYWLEVMSLVGATKEAITSANRVHQWLLQRPGEAPKLNSLAVLWDDVQRFITTFLEPISFGPLHIYISALPHCPTETEMWSLYGKYARVRMLHGDRMSRWPSYLWTRSASAEVRTVAFSPDGKVVAFGSDDSKIRLLDAQTGAAIGKPLTGHTETVWSVCFSPDGRLLASGSNDKTIRFWDAETGAAVGDPLIGHDGGVNAVCFLPNGKAVASGSDDETVRLWSTETGAAMGEPFTGHIDTVWSVCVSPDGKLLASGSEDNTVRLWDPNTGMPAGDPLNGDNGKGWSVCFSPDGRLLAAGSSDERIILWDTKTRTPVQEPLAGHSHEINSVCFSPDGKTLASGSDDMTIRLWNTETGAALGEPLTGHSARVWSVCFSPDGKLLASGSHDKTVRLWDPQTGAGVTGSLISHSAKVNSVRFSPDGKRVASVYDDHSIRLWDPQTGVAVGKPLKGHRGGVKSACFSPDGKLLASGSNDATIRLWDAQTGVAVGEPLRGHGWRVGSVCFSPDGNYLASGSQDRTIRLWDLQTRVQVGKPLKGHRDWVRSASFSPDGKYLASGSNDKTIRLWDPQTGAAVGEPLKGHSDRVMSVSFSPDGTLLSAQCDDGSLATWDVATRQRCDTPRNHSFYTHPRFQDHWITFGSFRFLWLPPQYWDMKPDEVALFDGMLASFPNGSPSILDVSQVVGTLAKQV